LGGAPSSSAIFESHPEWVKRDVLRRRRGTDTSDFWKEPLFVEVSLINPLSTPFRLSISPGDQEARIFWDKRLRESGEKPEPEGSPDCRPGL